MAVVDVDGALGLVQERVSRVRSGFFVYQDSDSADNHGAASGLFGPGGKTIVTGCVDDAGAPAGCSTNPAVLDRARGTVLQVRFDALAPTQFAGVNVEEPENWAANGRLGSGYDLRGATHVRFDVRSPQGVRVQFSVDDKPGSFVQLPTTWTDMSLPLSTFGISAADLAQVNVLFGVATNDVNAPMGGTVLLDRIRFEPIPTRQAAAIGLPLSTQTFGSLSVDAPRPGRVPIPVDQVSRNSAATYEAALSLRALLARGQTTDLQSARIIADALLYAIGHDNRGSPLVVAPDGATGLRNAYRGGEIALLNDQPAGARAGDTQLAGFSAGTTLCGASRYCLVLDGANGGNVAFGLMALHFAYERFGDVRYLDGARTLGRWIHGNLADTSGTGLGGYYFGYNDGGSPATTTLIRGKSIENNADIAAAFAHLAATERRLGDVLAANAWQQRSDAAGDFVMALFSATEGRFYAGTTPGAAGLDVVNTADFLDAQTFTTLAMAELPRYRNAIDWRRPVRWAMNHQAVTVSAAGRQWSGFNLTSAPTAGPNGVAWEFTGQMVVAMSLVGRLYSDASFAGPMASTRNQIRQAQQFEPFGDGRGVVGATMQDGDLLPPAEQCLSTTFQCIPARVGLAATTWGVFAELDVNPFPTVSGAAGFTPLTPARILDTRDGTGGFTGRVGPAGTINVAVTGVGGVPATGVGAVVMNVTVTEGTGPSYLTVHPSGQPRPLASNLNFGANQDVPNLVVAKVGADGKVAAYNNAGSVHVIFDVVGWFMAT